MRIRPHGASSAGLRVGLATALALLFVLSPGASRAAFPGGNGLIAVQEYVGGNFDIAVLPANGGVVRNLTRSRACDALPAWSPDGSRIAFERNARGRDERQSEIWVMNADGS